MIQQTLKEIAEETAGTTYLDCFRMSNLRRTIISIAPLCIQALLGIVFAASNSTYYMQTAGFSTQLSFKLEIVQQVLWLLGNVMSWFLINRVGRRGLTFWGPVCFDGCSFRHGCARRGREPRGHQRDRGPDPGLLLLVQRHHWCDCLHDPMRSFHRQIARKNNRDRVVGPSATQHDVELRASLPLQPGHDQPRHQDH